MARAISAPKPFAPPDMNAVFPVNLAMPNPPFDF
jgi:hypothetical protein